MDDGLYWLPLLHDLHGVGDVAADQGQPGAPGQARAELVRSLRWGQLGSLPFA